MPWPRFTLLTISLVSVLATPKTAHAQWYIAALLGGNHTQSASVTVTQPDRATSLRFDDVTFAARPLKAPQYYAWRVGRAIGPAKRFAVELEFIHLKVLANTAAAYPVSGRFEGADVAASPIAMDAYVQRYAMSHGLNFALVNLVIDRPLGGRFAWTGRAGAGVTLPHAESTIGGREREQYEYGGPGAGAGAGLRCRLGHGLSALIEYTLTIASPEISIDDGTGRMTAATHQVLAGVAFGPRR